MGVIEDFYPESRFGGFSDVDGTVAFYSRVQALLGEDMSAVDVGCGRGVGLLDSSVVYRQSLRTLRGKCNEVIGIDVDPEAATNPGIDEFRLMKPGKSWPVESSVADLILSDFVLEHVDEPDHFFSEVRRVLKPGGCFCARTTNRLGYVGLLASLVPNSSHSRVVGFAQRIRQSRDVFPTRYRVNTIWQIRRLLKLHGLHAVVYGHEAEPSYLRFSRMAYHVGKHLHALTPSVLSSCLFVFARSGGPANVRS